MTLPVDDALHRALKEADARQERSSASCVEKNPRLRGTQDQQRVRVLTECLHGQHPVTDDRLLLDDPQASFQ